MDEDGILEAGDLGIGKHTGDTATVVEIQNGIGYYKYLSGPNQGPTYHCDLHLVKASFRWVDRSQIITYLLSINKADPQE